MNEFKQRLQSILAIKKPILRNIGVQMDDMTSLDDTDSLDKTEICVAAEEHYGVPVQYNEVSQLRNVGELMALIREKKKNAC